MNDTTESTSIAGLPIPTKEKAARWAAHGGVFALVVAGIITFMPFINKALTLLLNGVWTVAQLGFAAAVTFFGAFAIMTAWPLYKRFVESCANKAVWAIFEYDPITPMMLWLKEVRRDRDELETEYRNVGGVIAQNEQTVNDNLTAAETADKKFAQAVKKYGQDSSEAQLMALEPGTLRETAERIKANTEPLYVVRDTLKEVVDATAFTERKAELDVSAFQQEFSAAQSVERATNAANRVLKARSERKQNAMLAMKIIHDKYAGSFGRLQGLRELSREVIMSVDMAKGTYHQEALERLKAESRFITGARKPEMLEAVPAGQANGVSFYKVPESVRASRK
jgi:hypothetical protein